MDILLARGQTHDIQITAKFLNFVVVTGDVSASILGHSITCRAGDSLNFDSADDQVRSVQLRNNGDSDATIAYELSPIRVHGASGASVTIDGAVQVSEIVNGVHVTADATVENGSVSVLPCSNIDSETHTINAGSTHDVCAHRDNARRRLLQLSVVGNGVITVAGRRLSADMFGGDAWELPFAGNLQAVGVSGTVDLTVIDLWSS